MRNVDIGHVLRRFHARRALSDHLVCMHKAEKRRPSFVRESYSMTGCCISLQVVYLSTCDVHRWRGVGENWASRSRGALNQPRRYSTDSMIPLDGNRGWTRWYTWETPAECDDNALIKDESELSWACSGRRVWYRSSSLRWMLTARL